MKWPKSRRSKKTKPEQIRLEVQAAIEHVKVLLADDPQGLNTSLEYGKSLLREKARERLDKLKDIE